MKAVDQPAKAQVRATLPPDQKADSKRLGRRNGIKLRPPQSHPPPPSSSLAAAAAAAAAAERRKVAAPFSGRRSSV